MSSLWYLLLSGGYGMKYSTATFPLQTPETVDECNNLSCDFCAIMYDTLHGARLPKCLRYSKSEVYLGMVT